MTFSRHNLTGHSLRGLHVRRPRPVAGLVAAAVLLVTGAGLLLTQILAPTHVERLLGNAKLAVEQVLPGPETPSVTLGELGGKKLLDRCDGTFIELEEYRITGVLPVYAAHNICGGDAILTWPVGQHVTLTGSDVVYEVVEERHTPKWGNIASLRGMTGDLALQTCYYGENRMRFLSLAPLSRPEP